MKKSTQISYSVSEQLELFLARVSEIQETQLIKKGFKPSFSLHSYCLEDSFKITSFEPNEDDLRSFLTIYRKFISRDSPIYIHKIFNVCHLHIKNEQLKNNLIKLRRMWNDELNQGFIKLKIDQKLYCPEEILDLWINAVYFHDDLDKIKLLEGLMSNEIFYTVARQIFLFLISETTRQIFYIGSVINTGLRDNHFDLND